MTAAAKRYQSLSKRATWCPKGRRFAANHPTLGSAWRSCTNGSFMAYWIGIELHTGATVWKELVQLRRDIGLNYTLMGGSVEAQARFATAIRARFNSDGTFRKRSRS